MNKRPTVTEQVRRANAILRHVQRLEPAMRWFLLQRLDAVECSPREFAKLRQRGWR